MTPDPLPVLDFWFRELTPGQWFGDGKVLDPVVRARFATLHEKARAGALDAWVRTPRGRLALIIVLDQFSRHIHRGQGTAFACDQRAQELALDGIAQGQDEQLNFAERHFFYMPLMHAEDMAIQKRALEQFDRLVAFATDVRAFANEHAHTIERFGRFPYRNAALGRETSPEEQDYLDSSNHPE